MSSSVVNTGPIETPYTEYIDSCIEVQGAHRYKKVMLADHRLN